MIVCKNCGTEIPSGYYHNCPVHFRTPAEAIKEAIAARDKWWLCLLQEVNEANDLKDLQERFAHLLRYVSDLGVK